MSADDFIVTPWHVEGDIDYDKLWEDDDYRDSISDELNKEVSHMRSAYFEYLQEIKEENS